MGEKSVAYNWGNVDDSDTVALLFSPSFEVFPSLPYKYSVGVLQTAHPVAESKECPPVPETRHSSLPITQRASATGAIQDPVRESPPRTCLPPQGSRRLSFGASLRIHVLDCEADKNCTHVVSHTDYFYF